jgi:MFS family permease
MAAHVSPHSTGLFSPDQRRLTFSTMSVIAVAAYNNLSVSAALPAIGDDLGHLAWLPWVVTVELVASAIAVLAVGPVIDSFGSKRVLRVLLVAFIVAAVIAALAPTMAVLIVGRALQGLASGALIATVMAAMGLAVPEHLRARAYATNSAVWGVMGLAGPAVAAGLLLLFDWPALFLVNVPVAIFAFAVGRNAFPGPTEDAAASTVDRRGLALAAAFTLVGLGALSALAWWTPILVVAAALLVVAYVRYERAAANPVLQIRHIVGNEFRWLNITTLLVIGGGIAANSFLPLYAKAGRGFTTGEAAFTVVFMTVGWTIGAFASSKLVETRTGEDVIVVSASVLALAVGSAALLVGLDVSLWIVFPCFFASGAGIGGVSSVGLSVLQTKAVPAQMGRVNSAHQFVRTLGFSYGAAIGGGVLFGVVAAKLGSAELVRDLLSDDAPASVPVETIDSVRDGFFWALVAAAALCSLAVLASIRLRITSISARDERTEVPVRG